MFAKALFQAVHLQEVYRPFREQAHSHASGQASTALHAVTSAINPETI
ncbi:hypothetical protein KPSA3_04860 [Pseudomonas syringae pv. actinidiae]|uniref:Uncharacterized protein n=1 Tax=Pseudomonas syringae pv. actinidiae TaxID=103796 RepID=A0AAN4Q7T6_PSESF|nr:hypothetical protein KPSA3_04860 [Pseudomonas syringae pv. actinidiae]